MLAVFVLFWLVLGWALYDGDLYPKEAAIYAVIWIVLLGCFFVPKLIILSIIGNVLLDAVLLLKVYGQSPWARYP